GVSPRAGSKIGWSALSCRVTDTAPAASSASSMSGASSRELLMRTSCQAMWLLLAQTMFQIMDVDTAAHKGGIDNQILMQGGVGLDAANDQFVECHLHFFESSSPIGCIGNDFCDHGVII